MEECEVCQGSLTGGELVDPWEDGDNPNAYTMCRNCGQKNILYGYGGQD